MIQLKDICKIYAVDNKPFFALKNVSLEIRDGEMVLIHSFGSES